VIGFAGIGEAVADRPVVLFGVRQTVPRRLALWIMNK